MNMEAFINFEGKKVLITGASSGIGRAIAVELDKCGAFVVLSGRDSTRLKETADLLKSGNFKILQLDLKDHDTFLPAIQELSRELGRFYGFCHAAGMVQTRPLASSKVADIKSMMDVNFLAGIEMARILSRRDIAEDEGGSILFISSIYALIGMPGETGYSGTKGAISAAARAMAVELARRHIRVNSISPGFVKTPMTSTAMRVLSEQQIKDIESAHPLGIGSAEDVAKASAFLLAPQSKWITGADFVIDGGRSIH